jgi:hypothetical protein
MNSDKMTNPILKTDFENHPLKDCKLLELEMMPYTGFHSPVSSYDSFVNYGFFTNYDLSPFTGKRLKTSDNDKLVLLTGGSGAMGWGATGNDKMISSVLETLLNERLPIDSGRWIVLNLANAGWIAFQEFVALTIYGAPENPDYIISFSGRNNFFVPVPHGEGVPNYLYFSGQKKLGDIYHRSINPTKAERIIPFLKIFRLHRMLKDAAARPVPNYSAAEVDKAANFYSSSMENLFRFFPGVPIMACLQPTLYLLEDYVPWQRREAFGNIEISELKVHVRAYYKSVRENLESMCNARDDGHFVDFSEYFDSQFDQYFVDDCHFTDQGQLKIAEKMYDVFVENMFKATQ